jgi:hypothetical protein
MHAEDLPIVAEVCVTSLASGTIITGHQGITHDLLAFRKSIYPCTDMFNCAAKLMSHDQGRSSSNTLVPESL